MHLFKYSKTKNKYIAKCFYTFVLHLNIFNILIWNDIYSCEIKAGFQKPLLRSSVSHAPSETILICWFDTQETFLIIIINVEDRYTA